MRVCLGGGGVCLGDARTYIHAYDHSDHNRKDKKGNVHMPM